MLNLMNLSGVSDWVANSFPTIRIVLVVLTILCSITFIIFALFAPAGKDSGNVITGGGMSETFYSQNKSKMSEGFVKKLLIALSITIAVLIVLFYVTVIIYRGPLN